MATSRQNGVLVLVVAQLPVSVWLVRRMSRSQEERGRLLRSALTASDRERRSIARELHDSVVQDLTGAGYALGALDGPLATELPDRSRRIVREVSAVIRSAVGGLRTLMVDLYPPELTRTGLSAALDDLAAPLRAAGIDVLVRAELGTEPARRWCRTIVLAGAATETTVTGLTNGTAVNFRVQAANAAGTGALSTASNTVAPGAVPAAPGILAPAQGAAGGTLTAVANWAAPAVTGGAAITNYRVTALRMAADGTTAVGTRPGRSSGRPPGRGRSRSRPGRTGSRSWR